MRPSVDGIKSIQLRNSSDVTINPATEDTLATVASGSGIPTTISNGRKTITSAGTAEKLTAGSVTAKRVIITALESNTGAVVIGGASVVASLASRQGVVLYATQSLELSIDDLTKIYLDVTVSGEGVTYLYTA